MVNKLSVKEKEERTYPRRAPSKLTKKARVFKTKGKQIIIGEGKITQESKLPPIMAIMVIPSIPFSICQPSSLIALGLKR
jgi:hypothetical protein